MHTMKSFFGKKSTAPKVTLQEATQNVRDLIKGTKKEGYKGEPGRVHERRGIGGEISRRRKEEREWVCFLFLFLFSKERGYMMMIGMYVWREGRDHELITYG